MTFGIRFSALVAVIIGLLALPALASAHGGGTADFSPGAAGAGDPYFPLDGNGGYDTKHYLLDLKYNPATDVLEGTATIRARATQNLSRFNLDFDGMTVQSIEIDGRRASWRRDGAELIDHAARRACATASSFTIEVRYRGIPETLDGSASRLHPHGRRRAHHRRAPRGRDLVPGQRPSDRQGRVHVQDHRSRGPRGGRQRRARGPFHEARLDDLDLGRKGADGLVPRDGVGRRVRPALLQAQRHQDLGRVRPRPLGSDGNARAPARSSRSPRWASRRTSGSRGRSPFPRAGRTCPSGSSATPRRTGTSSSSRRMPRARTTGRRSTT